MILLLKKIRRFVRALISNAIAKRRCKKLGANYVEGCFIGKNVRRFGKSAQLILHSGSKIHDNCVIWGNGIISIGVNSSIGENSWIYANKNGGVYIGNEVNCAANLYMIDSDHGTKLGVQMNKQPLSSEKIIIGNDVWIGANATILKGVKLGNGCVVGACACVTKSFNDNSIVGGVPAKLIKNRS